MSEPPVVGGGITINPAPGGAVTTVCPAGETCAEYRGEFDDDYRGLNGLAMSDLLGKLTAAGHDRVAALRAHVNHASGVNVGRLMAALDAVWFRNFDTHTTQGKDIVAADLDEFLKFDVDQRDVVNKYMIANLRPPSPSAAAPAAPAAAGGSGGLGGTPFPDSQLSELDTPEETEFKRKVYNAHVAATLARGRKFNLGTAAEDLVRCEGGRLHKDAAPAFTQLLARARADLAALQAPLADGVTVSDDVKQARELAAPASAIGIGSAYRSAPEELAIWQVLFPKYFHDTTRARQAAVGGEFGDAAVGVLVNHYSGRKAAPGFGNHTLGIAVDFTTTQGTGDSAKLGPDGSQTALWMASWLHVWLVHNAGTFHITFLATEAWHWEFHS